MLSPQPHIVQCLAIDLQRRWYKRAHIIWTSACAGGILRPLAPYEHQFVGSSALILSVRALPKHLIRAFIVN